VEGSIGERFREIINFAIEREKEAVEFYRNLGKEASFSDKKKLIREFELMEIGHITILENIGKGVVEEIDIPRIKDLHISDYTVSVEVSGSMSYQDLLITAMKREEASLKLYSDLAGRTMDPDMRVLFQKLASEESRHKLYFERLYDDDILTQD